MMILDGLLAAIAGVVFGTRKSSWSWLALMGFAVLGLALPGGVVAWLQPEWHSSYLFESVPGPGVVLGSGLLIVAAANAGYRLGQLQPRLLPVVMLLTSLWMWWSLPRMLALGGLDPLGFGRLDTPPAGFLVVVLAMAAVTGVVLGLALYVSRPGRRAGSEVATYCRICEAHCGLKVQLDQERIRSVRPDREHPVTRGYGCIKGMGLGDLVADGARLDHPLKRVGDEFVRISWDQAIAEIGSKIGAIRGRHGARSVGMYRGNPSFFSFSHVLFADDLMRAWGSPNLFTSVSIDSNNKFFVATEMFGHPMVQPLPDLTHTSFLMILGSNPAVSQMSIIQVAHPLKKLQAIVDRGGRVVTVDPRRNETAQRVGEHHFVRPGTDAALLLAMLHELTLKPVTPSELKVEGLEEAISLARPWTPERAAEVCGLSAEAIRDLARDYAEASGAAIYHSTGVNMSGFGSLCAWLTQVLALVSGNLDRRGGHVLVRSPIDLVALSPHQARGRDPHRTLASGWPRVGGAFPSGALVDEITVDDPERIRALIVSAGNPAHSIPGDRFRKGRDQLDLLVCIDLYLGETAALADYVLPAADTLEHSDFPVGWLHLQETPYAQYTPAVVAPSGERREEWRIFCDLALATGVSPLGMSVCNVFPWANRLLGRLPGRPQLVPDHLLRGLLWWGGVVSMDDLLDAPSGIALEPNDSGALAEQLSRLDTVIRAAPGVLVAEVARFEAQTSHAIPPGTFSIVGLRERRTHNSWMHNHPSIRHPRESLLRMNPSDALRCGIDEGSMVQVIGDVASAEIRVRLTDEVMPGVVCMPHGWGHEGSGVARARDLAGPNLNAVLPGGAEHMEPSSGQATMTGHRVRVVPAA